MKQFLVTTLVLIGVQVGLGSRAHAQAQGCVDHSRTEPCGSPKRYARDNTTTFPRTPISLLSRPRKLRQGVLRRHLQR